MAPKDKESVSLTAESRKDSAEKSKDAPEGADPADTLSEEDRELKERLETCVTTLINADNEASVTVEIRLKALDVIIDELIRELFDFQVCF